MSKKTKKPKAFKVRKFLNKDHGLASVFAEISTMEEGISRIYVDVIFDVNDCSRIISLDFNVSLPYKNEAKFWKQYYKDKEEKLGKIDTLVATLQQFKVSLLEHLEYAEEFAKNAPEEKKK